MKLLPVVFEDREIRRVYDGDEKGGRKRGRIDFSAGLSEETETQRSLPIVSVI